MNNWITNVHQFVDGVDSLSAASVNPVLTALTTRDQYLFEQINSIAAEAKLVATNQLIASSLSTNSVGVPVYFDTTTGTPILNPAVSNYTSAVGDGHLFPSPSAYIFGIIKQVYAGSGPGTFHGDIYLRGLITDVAIIYVDLLDTQSLAELETPGTLVPGPLYLSSHEAGKLSTFSAGASVFVGYYLGDHNFVLAPNIDSLGQLYHNYKVYLNPVAAGSVTGTTTLSITNPDITKLGWITATQATSELGITPPAGAKFYYNVPTDANILALRDGDIITEQQAQQAFLIKKALPAHPASYVLLFINGVLQTQYDVDHTGGTYIVDSNGVWWTEDDAAYVPFQDSPVIQLFITKLNPNYAAGIVTSLVSDSDAISVTDINGLTNSTGDLKISLDLNIGLVATSSGTGVAVQSFSYDKPSGSLTGNLAPVVNTITVGPGLNYSVTDGAATLSLSNFSLSGEVTDIEPQESDFVYKGLHSYLRLARPQANQQIGFIGKIKIPDGIPANASLSFNLLGFTESGVVSGGSYASFAFDYAVSNTGAAISTSTTNSIVYTAATNFPLLQQAKVNTGFITTISGSPVRCFVIPSTSLTPGSYVNFRIARTYDTNATYANKIGVIGVTWQIE